MLQVQPVATNVHASTNKSDLGIFVAYRILLLYMYSQVTLLNIRWLYLLLQCTAVFKPKC